jgi:hypothetical protein
MEDLHSIPVVSAASLLDSVLPSPPPSFDIGKVKLQLDIDGVTNQAGWAAFGDTPKNSSAHESVAFQPLQVVFDKIIECTSNLHSGLKKVLEMKHNPSRAPLSSRENASRPDSILELLLKLSVTECVEASSNWEDIPLSMEFKKGDSEKDRHDVGMNPSVETFSSLLLC